MPRPQVLRFTQQQWDDISRFFLEVTKDTSAKQPLEAGVKVELTDEPLDLSGQQKEGE